MITIHYYASKTRKFIVFGIDGKTTIDSKTQDVSGKIEANKIAKQYQAKPWNY